MAHWTTLFSHVSGRLEIRKLCNFCGSSSSWGQVQAVSCSWCFHCFICEFVKCLLFFLNFFFFFANKPERNPAIRSTSGQLDEPRSLENSWSWFYLLCQLYRADVMSTSCSWRHLPSPMTWGGGGRRRRKNWLQYSWAPDWVVQVSFV